MPLSFFILGIVLVVFSFILLFFVLRKQNKLGMLGKPILSLDSGENPGLTLVSKVIPLVGRPDALIKNKGKVIPVEIKTGKTPATPHKNHVAQLMAYCYLIEEYFGTRPPGGYIRYPEKEFLVQYTDEARVKLQGLVEEVLRCKKNNQEFQCVHPYHNIQA